MSFLQEDYKQPKSGGNYLKLKKGLNKIRILSDSITGRSDRKDNKPVRTKTQQPAFDPEKKPKHFWAFLAWDYDDNRIKICEITQKSIQDKILSLYKDEEWGDPKGYDLKITKEGDLMDTTYEINPSPKKELDKDIVNQYKALNINLDLLFDGIDPFTQISSDGHAFPEADDSELPFN